ncbi:MAG: ATP-dependent dethiobiotin synthetase BioD [Actinomycetota bacterium]
MRNVVVVTGTGTEVGKTWVIARLIERLRAADENVAARKPVQSFDAGHGPTDADLLAMASGEPPALVCPPHRSYELAMAPPMAATALDRLPFSIAELVVEIDVPPAGVVFVEGVGGPASPLADDGDTIALAEALDADRVLLVAGAGLGAINDIRLASAAFGGRPITVFLNRFDPGDRVHRANRSWLTDRCALDVYVDLGELALSFQSTASTRRSHERSIRA